MKLKYYLRGLGIGIIITTLILAVSFSGKKTTYSDEDIIKKAQELGMVMPDSQTEGVTTEQPETETSKEEKIIEPENATVEIESQVPETESVEPVSETEQNQEGMEQQAYKEITIGDGDYCRQISEKLLELELIDDPEAFQKYMLEIGLDHNVYNGTFQIPVGASLEDIAKIITTQPQ